MKIAIRDDDTSYYTSPDELISAFSGLEWFPISLSIVPFATANHAGTKPYGDIELHGKYASIGENLELVSFIKEKITLGQFEIVQHGINHEYIKDENGQWQPETVFLNRQSLSEGMQKGKMYLEEVFNMEIKTFAAASNAVTDQCAFSLDELGMNTNSLISRHFDRSFSLDYLINYTKCNLFKLLTGMRYGGILKFQYHKELTTYEFLTYEKAMEIYRKNKKYDYPLVFYTHYWNLNNDKNKQSQLVKFVEDLVTDGVEPTFLSECFK